MTQSRAIVPSSSRGRAISESQPRRARNRLEFPIENSLDAWDVDEPRTQWFFNNPSLPGDAHLSRAWIAPDVGAPGLGLAEIDDPYEVFQNPRSALVLLEKLAVLDARTVREWPMTPHAGLQGDQAHDPDGERAYPVFVYLPSQPEFRGVGAYRTYATALAEARQCRSTHRAAMVARVIRSESLWR